MIRVIPLEEIQQVVDHANCLAAVEQALVALAAGAVETPDEIALSLKPAGDIHVKGAYISGTRWVAFKVATGSFPGAPNAGCSLLLDSATGEPKVVLDDDGWLTEMRTAAAGAIATDLLANPGPLRVAVVGAGVQAGFQVEALRHRREISELRIWGRRVERAQSVASELGGTAVDDLPDAVADVDAIITATSSTSPILTREQLPRGVHITAMGADTVGKNELDPEILTNAQVIVADDVSTCRRVGELQHATEQCKRAISLAQLVSSNAAAGRQNSDQLTVADLCGIGTYDAAVAGLTATLLGIN